MHNFLSSHCMYIHTIQPTIQEIKCQWKNKSRKLIQRYSLPLSKNIRSSYASFFTSISMDFSVSFRFENHPSIRKKIWNPRRSHQYPDCAFGNQTSFLHNMLITTSTARHISGEERWIFSKKIRISRKEKLETLFHKKAHIF